MRWGDEEETLHHGHRFPAADRRVELVRLSLKFRAAAATALVVVLMIGVLAVIQYDAYVILRDSLQSQQDERVELMAERLDDRFEGRELILRRIASQLAPMLERPPHELKKLAAQAVSIPEAFSTVFLVWPDGEVAFNTTPIQTKQMNLADRGYIQQIVHGASVAISEPLISRGTDTLSIFMAIPIRAEDGRLRAILSGGLYLLHESFLQELNHNRIGTTGYYCLISSGENPLYVIHPDRSKLLTSAKAFGESCGTLGPQHPWEFVWPTRPIVARYLLASAGWEVVGTFPAKEAFSPLVDVRYKLLLAATIGLAVVVLLVWLVVRRLLVPLGQLHKVVQESTMDLACYVGRDECHVFVNNAYERRFGRPTEQIVGLTIHELWGAAAYADIKPYLDRAFGGSTVSFDWNPRNEVECLDATYQPAWNDARDTVVGLHISIRDVTAERQRVRMLERQAQSDPLTELLNRKGFDRQLAFAKERADTDNLPMALLLIDLDAFKPVNDTYGHVVGDKLLRLFAKRLSSCVRECDAVARIGGDEFAIILERIPDRDAAARVAAATVALASHPYSIDDLCIRASATVGVAICAPEDGQTSSELFLKADTALYAAKRDGKGRYKVYGELPV
ncbi:diguanylate cyclase domain-containing protein [Cupriavidus sp. H39]|uniref:diguanylate cyclase domain-containing protein n=1 Tax=Cupriavidus sp. H39 TaxID=3401635 RepID=UPI003CFD0E10